jgi:hypothetical protein
MRAWGFIASIASGRRRGVAGPVAKAFGASWLALLAAGCGEQRFSGDELVTASRAVAVDVGRALALPPAGSLPVIGVTQQTYENGVAQTISLATRGRTTGENALYVAFLTAADLPEGAGVEGNLLKEPGIDDFAIAKEMDERLPGVAMAPSSAFVQNKYGPFGYAFGRGAGGEACLYAWQRLARGDSLFRPRSGLISLRVRVCDPAGTEVSLLRLAYEYSLNARLRRSGWNPVGDAPSPSPDLGEAGAPIYPQQPQPFFDELPQRPRAARPRPERRPRPAAAEAPEPISARPLEGYPTVPPPPAP